MGAKKSTAVQAEGAGTVVQGPRKASTPHLGVDLKKNGSGCEDVCGKSPGGGGKGGRTGPEGPCVPVRRQQSGSEGLELRAEGARQETRLGR